MSRYEEGVEAAGAAAGADADDVPAVADGVPPAGVGAGAVVVSAAGEVSPLAAGAPADGVAAGVGSVEVLAGVGVLLSIGDNPCSSWLMIPGRVKSNNPNPSPGSSCRYRPSNPQKSIDPPKFACYGQIRNPAPK